MTRLPERLISAAATLRIRVPEEQLSFCFTRSAGPGGQNVNKVSTRVTLLFDLLGTRLLSRREKNLISEKLRTRITKDGQFRVVSMRHRTQPANRRAAMERFYELIAWALDEPAPRIPTRPTKGACRRRLEDKRKRSEQKRMRRGTLSDE